MSYLRYLYLFVYSGVQHMLCCVFVLFGLRLVYPVRGVRPLKFAKHRLYNVN
jgi:hypothetical protein